VNPVLAGSLVAMAMALGVSYKMMIFGFPPVFVIGAMVVRGIRGKSYQLSRENEGPHRH
jgi:hypothetical protein